MGRDCCWLDAERRRMLAGGGIGHVPDAMYEMEAGLEWDLRWL